MIEKFLSKKIKINNDYLILIKINKKTSSINQPVTEINNNLYSVEYEL